MSLRMGRPQPDAWQLRLVVSRVVKAVKGAVEGAQPDILAGSLPLKDGHTLLHIACESDDAGAVEALLAAGVDKDARRTKDGFTALMIASQNDYTAVAEALLAAGANTELKEEANGATALHIASGMGHRAVVEALLRAGADKEARTAAGATALVIASANGHMEAVGALLEEKANVEAMDNNGATALHMASAEGHRAVVEVLVREGANKEARTAALTSLLEGHSTPRVISLRTGEAAARQDNLLLVDASAVQYFLVKKLALGPSDWQTSAWHKQLYLSACRYYGGLKRAGLRLVLVLDGAPAPGLEATYTDRRRRAIAGGRGFMPPTAEMVLQQAYRDLELEVERSTQSADQLLLAWARGKGSGAGSLFAVLTNDSDFYVYGVPCIVHVEDVVVDARGVTLHAWSPPDCWRRWAAAAAGGGGSMPSLLTRAQVAAVLGNDASKDLRRRLDARRAVAAAGGGRGRSAPRGTGLLTSPAAVARAVLMLGGGGALDLAFFRAPPLSLKGFTQPDLELFNGVVRSYIGEDAAARDGSALQRLTLRRAAAADSDEENGDTAPAVQLPWVHPAVLARLSGSEAVPSMLVTLASRGLGGLLAPEPFWSAQQALRRQAAGALLSADAPGPSYEYDPTANRLHQLTSSAPAAAAGAARAQWFNPATHLPGVPVVAMAGDAAAADGGAVSRQPTVAGTVEAIRAAHPGLPPALAAYYALLLHAADPAEGAWDAGQVREVLLPGLPADAAARAAAAAPAAAAAAAEEEEEEAAAAGMVRAGVPRGKVLDVGSALGEEDWNDIDAKDAGLTALDIASANGHKEVVQVLRTMRPWPSPMALIVDIERIKKMPLRAFGPLPIRPGRGL
ncbi:Ankyrin-2 [Tetrabaena socialis]|uniref:Ankyrin-2 n=1 Tax=Tetrabaena socialis TaxID=47790 RepID=A0A2J7ZL23_9CHLO|nr:Ankyrin-2 [Tetrabaena socialis]|eukprot:PNH00969.1 Ankyrin-2 [Tetrabaena socialis]